jgi:hypothetical protein
MSGGMPYQLEKGPTFSVSESMLDCGGDPQKRLMLLGLMLGGTDPNQLPTLESGSLDSGPWNKDQRQFHMNTDWFGRQRTPGGGWAHQDPFDPSAPNRTGYWRQWHGDAQRIVAETFKRAIEVSLGLDDVPDGTDVSTLTPTRCWPIEIFWRCPAPWFEGWVTWRRETTLPRGDGIVARARRLLTSFLTGSRDPGGHVTVHLHTPSHCNSVLLLSPRRTGPPTLIPDYKDNPVRCDMDRGMWVIAHEQQVPHNNYAVTEPTPPGTFPLPTFGPFVESTGDVVTVQPNEPDGGVLANGRAY